MQDFFVGAGVTWLVIFSLNTILKSKGFTHKTKEKITHFKYDVDLETGDTTYYYKISK